MESRAVKAQSQKATIQPGFLTYQEGTIFPPWGPTCPGERGQKSLLDAALEHRV